MRNFLIRCQEGPLTLLFHLLILSNLLGSDMLSGASVVILELVEET